MYINYTNEDIMKAMDKAMTTLNWEEYLLLQEEADIRNI